ncbi:right-handed parallel beta-helix repeat-containing protein, partial [Methanothermococcus sp. SCGC AD-155-C09]|nr:right-handed parallel beta-helix repeat-containing protein [Methanothermococcus sp. SCGC AD-155-C09]
NSSLGVNLHSSSNNGIIDNNITSNNDCGIFVYNSINNSIVDNNISNNRYDGIYVRNSINNSIIDNNITSNNDYGIFVYNSSNNNIIDSSILNNSHGIYLSSSSNNSIIGNNISNNKYDGIHLYKSSNNSITNNNISDNRRGIELRYSKNNIIKDNTFINDGVFIWGYLPEHWIHTIENNTVNNKPLYYFKNETRETIPGNAGQIILANCSEMIIENLNVNNTDAGIQIGFSSQITIRNNSILNNRYGIRLWDSSNNSITNNNISDNRRGIELIDSNNNIIKDNTFINDGVVIEGYLMKHWIHTIENNTVNNKPLYYFKNETRGTIPGNAGQIILANCSEMIIENLNVNNTDAGIQIGFSSQITIRNNSILNNRYGIRLCYSSNNIITNNNISDNNKRGIELRYSSNNSITNNNIWDNGDGIDLYKSSNNSITNNNISDNRRGINLGYSNNNTIYLNNFIDNKDNVDSFNSTNFWNSPEKITYTYNGIKYTNYLGNYWDNYNGNDTDEDGIGDTPYNIGLDVDNYPLMQPWEYYLISTPTIDAPNLKIEYINVNTPIYNGTRTEINLTILNNGTENITTTFPVNITIKNTSGDVVYTNRTDIEGLNAGAEEIITFYWTPNNIGIYSITAFLDPNNIINESDESDNNITLSNVEISGFENESPTLNNNSEIITLKKGWNTLSIPHRANISFSNPETVGSIITYYDNKWHDKSNLEPLYGYYIYCNNDTQMNVTYITIEPAAPPARPVFKGWNLVGVNPGKNDTNGVKLIDFILPVEDSWIMILDPKNNNLYTKNDYISSTLLHPYDVYWMYNKENDILPGRNLN